MSDADYRDLARAGRMVDVRYPVLAMMLSYKPPSGTETRSYQNARNSIDAIYASATLPLDGLLLIGSRAVAALRRDAPRFCVRFGKVGAALA